jgi:hypothetical protein
MKKIKKILINQFMRFLSHPKVRRRLIDLCKPVKQIQLDNIDNPYFSVEKGGGEVDGAETIFITGRFRSGSTLLWNIFRNIEGCTAYYEPFNERRWFDQSGRGEQVDNTHLGVTDYWNEYNGLDRLADFYNQSWVDTDLYMDESSWDPAMKEYVNALIQGKSKAILQFNRIDFRLPWIKRHFPKNKIIHIYRNHRDQWISFLRDPGLMNKNDVLNTYEDGFYLDPWCHDLSKYFPFLDKELTPHPYARFYYLWKLSYLAGQQYSDISISFENLVLKPRQTLKDIFDNINWANIDIDELVPLIESPQLGKWIKYADADWFESFESECERNIELFLNGNH